MHGERGGLRCRSTGKGRIIFDYITETVPALLEISLNGVGIISHVECGCSKLKNTATDFLAPRHLAGAKERLILRSQACVKNLRIGPYSPNCAANRTTLPLNPRNDRRKVRFSQPWQLFPFLPGASPQTQRLPPPTPNHDENLRIEMSGHGEGHESQRHIITVNISKCISSLAPFQIRLIS